LLTIASTLLVWASLRHCYRSPWAAFGGGLIVALSPAQHYYAQCLLTESLSAFLVTLSIYLIVVANKTALTKKRLYWRFLAGVSMGASILVRPNLLAGVFPSILSPLSKLQGESTFRRYVVSFLISLLAVLIIYLPWGLFNARRGLITPQGSLGLHVHAWANLLGVGKPYSGLAPSNHRLDRVSNSLNAR
jgi:4-amino-4-deoxy-L-arabinose transferase-like glycosyltransferase